jgi:hypothetical protein
MAERSRSKNKGCKHKNKHPKYGASYSSASSPHRDSRSQASSDIPIIALESLTEGSICESQYRQKCSRKPAKWGQARGSVAKARHPTLQIRSTTQKCGSANIGNDWVSYENRATSQPKKNTKIASSTSASGKVASALRKKRLCTHHRAFRVVHANNTTSMPKHDSLSTFSASIVVIALVQENCVIWGRSAWRCRGRSL